MPILREEQYLAAIAGENVTLPSPVLRKEQYLFAIANGEGTIPELPVTREERYLAILAGEEYTTPEPETQLEKYMAKACGLEIEVPTPITRIEQYWAQIAEQSYWKIETLTGSLPLTFESKGDALNNYRVYGTTSGVGDETENLVDMADLIDAPPGKVGDSEMDAALTLTLLPNTTYTLLSTGFGSSDASRDSDIYRSVYFNGSNRGNCVYAGRPRSSMSDNDGIIKIGFMKSRTNAQQYINGSAYVCLLEGDHTSTEDDIVPYGYQIPLTNTNGQQSETYPLYIGSSKLYEEEYLDYESGKVYKRTENKFDKDAQDYDNGFRKNHFLNTGGSAVDSDNFNISEYIPIASNKTYQLYYGKTANSPCVYLYTANKGTGTGAIQYSSTSPITFTTGDNDAYVRISYRKNAIDSTMLAENELPASYIPYLQPTDPPVPFPSVQTFSGENTLDSTETIEQAEITGKIKEVVPNG